MAGDPVPGQGKNMFQARGKIICTDIITPMHIYTNTCTPLPPYIYLHIYAQIHMEDVSL